MRKITQKELAEILVLHKKWLCGEDGGERADLSRAYLCWADMRGADLGEAYLEGAKLTVANMEGADLSRAKLRGADLIWAILTGADLEGTDLQDARLEGAILTGTILDTEQNHQHEDARS